MPDSSTALAAPKPKPSPEMGTYTAPVLSRRDHFAIAFGAAIIGRQAGRTPGDLAREVVKLTDTFLAQLDGGQ